MSGAGQVQRKLAAMSEEIRADMHRAVTKLAGEAKRHPLTRESVGASPATDAICTQLKAAKIVC